MELDGHESTDDARGQAAGFTLVEVLVAVMIIGVLVGVAVVTMRGAMRNAQDTATKADLRLALTTAKVHYADVESYAGLTAAVLESIEDSLAYVEVAATDTGHVGFGDLATQRLVMVLQSKTGTYYCIAISDGDTHTGSHATLANVDTAAECTGGW